MKNLFSILLIILPLLGISQEEFTGQIRWGEPIKVKKNSVSSLIGIANNNVYLLNTQNPLKPKKQQNFIQTSPQNSLSIQSQNKDYKGNQLWLYSSFIFSERLVFISSYYDKSNDEMVYLLYENNNGDPTNVIEIGKLKDVMAKRKYTMPQIGALISEDKKTLIITFDNEIIVFKENLQEISRNVLNLYEYMAPGVSLADEIRLSIIGFDAITSENKSITKRETMTTGGCSMLFYNGSTFEKIEIDISRTINSISSKMKDNGEIIVYGLYSNEEASSVSGAFFIEMNEKAGIEKITTKDFEPGLITPYWKTEKQREKAEQREVTGKENNDPVFYDYLIHDLIIKENGDMTLLAEQYHMFSTTHTYSVNGTPQITTSDHYVYDDIIAVNYTKDNDIDWIKTVYKRQRTVDDRGRYSSFFATVHDNTIFLIYNDSEANAGMQELEQTNTSQNKKARNNTLAAMYSISEDGTIKHGKLFDFEEEAGRRLVPKACAKMTQNEIFLFTSSMKTYTPVLGLLTF